MRLSIAKCVWGARYVRTMLDVNLPSLLAPGNVPAAAARLPLEHLLVTTPADRAVIEAHPAYQALTRLIPCRIEPLQEMAATPDYMGQINQMNLAHRQILADCRARDATWVFDQPDHVWGDGSLDHLATLALRGARCVLFAGIRTNREQMVPILENWRGDATGTGPVMAIGNEPLLRLAIEHMHVHDQIRFWGPRFSTIGLAPAATFFRPSERIACASTVAVVVPSPATSLVLEATSLTSCAPMFSYGSLSSISLATVTPSLVMVGEPHFLSITTLRPRGPRVTFTARATAFAPRSRDRRASSSKAIILAAMLLRSPSQIPDTGARWGCCAVLTCQVLRH